MAYQGRGGPAAYPPRGGGGGVAYDDGYYEDEEEDFAGEGGDGGSIMEDEYGNLVRLHPRAVEDPQTGAITVPPEVNLEEMPELAYHGGWVKRKAAKATGAMAALTGQRAWKDVWMRLEGLDLVFYNSEPPELPEDESDPDYLAARPKQVAVFEVDDKLEIVEDDHTVVHKNKEVRDAFLLINGEGDSVQLCTHPDDREDWLTIVERVADAIADAKRIEAYPYVRADEDAAGSTAGGAAAGAGGGSVVTGGDRGSMTGGPGGPGGRMGGRRSVDSGGARFSAAGYGPDGMGMGMGMGGSMGGSYVDGMDGGDGDFYAPPEVLAAASGVGAAPPYTAKGAGQSAKAAASRAAATLAAAASAKAAADAVVTASAGPGKKGAGAGAAAAAAAAADAAEADEKQLWSDEAQSCTAHGPGLYEAVRGETTHFVVTACDVTGVEKSYGGDPVTAALVSDALHMDLTVNDNGDGTYTIHYAPPRAGEYELRVAYAGFPIYGSPFHLSVSQAPTAANHCVAVGDGTSIARPHAHNTFTITARDQFDEARKGGGDNFIITVAGGGKAHPILDHGDGSYTVTYEVDTAHKAYVAAASQAPAVAAGGPIPMLALEVHISLQNEGFAYPRPIKGSPFRPKVVIPELQAALHQASLVLHSTGSLAPLALPTHLAGHGSPGNRRTSRMAMGDTGASALSTSLASLHISPSAAATHRGAGAGAGAAAGISGVFSPGSLGMGHHGHGHTHSHHSHPGSPTAEYGAGAGVAGGSPTASLSLSLADSARHQQAHAAAQAQQYELAAKEAAVDAGLREVESMRRRLEADRSAVDAQMARMAALGEQVRRDSERLAEQARAFQTLAIASGSPGHGAGGSGSPLGRTGGQQQQHSPLGRGVYTAPGGVAPVDDHVYGGHGQQLFGHGHGSGAYSPSGAGAGGASGRGSPSGAGGAGASGLLMSAPAGFGGHGRYGGGGHGSPALVHGLGASSASAYGAGAGASSSSEVLFDPDVMALFDRYKKPLHALWQFYASLSGPTGAGEGVDARRFVECLADYDVSPTFIGRRELKAVFIAAARAHGTLLPASPSAEGAGSGSSSVGGCLTYAGFIEALGRTALASLSKPAFAHLYPAPRDKVLVLLEMWGLADARKLSDMQHRPRASSRGAGAVSALGASASSAATPSRGVGSPMGAVLA